jgi:hypothetical protein
VRHAHNLCFGAQRIRGMLLNDVSSSGLALEPLTIRGEKTLHHPMVSYLFLRANRVDLG